MDARAPGRGKLSRTPVDRAQGCCDPCRAHTHRLSPMVRSWASGGISLAARPGDLGGVVDRAAGHMSPVAVDILVPTLRRVNWTKLTHLAPVRRFEHPTPADDMPFVHNVLAPARGALAVAGLRQRGLRHSMRRAARVADKVGWVMGPRWFNGLTAPYTRRFRRLRGTRQLKTEVPASRKCCPDCHTSPSGLWSTCRSGGRHGRGNR
jgi:hypothetical protein